MGEWVDNRALCSNSATLAAPLELDRLNVSSWLAEIMTPTSEQEMQIQNSEIQFPPVICGVRNRRWKQNYP